MAFFGVTHEIIDEVLPHPNADKLEIGKLKGINFRFVIPKGQYQAGDHVLYFPVDSVLPEKTAKALGLFGKLAGKNKDRIKSIRLRGEISQGVVGSTELLSNPEESNTELITQELGVTKYEPPVIPCKAGKLIPLPCGLSAYDIEGAERNMDVVEQLMDVPVIVTEKIEGQNFSMTWNPTEERIYVNQRNYSIQPIEGKKHDFWRLAEDRGWLNIMDYVVDTFGKGNILTLYGEFIGPGIQGNIYKEQEHDIQLFDLKINEDYLDAVEFIEQFSIDRRVPTVFSGGTLREFLQDRDIVEASHGVSTLNAGTFREGIVIKPEREFRIEGFGRAIIKQRDPIYLSNEK